jgi:hypothetical protein
VQLCISKARLTKIEMLKDIKHDRIRKLEKTGKKHSKRRIVSVNLHAFFMNMVAEKPLELKVLSLAFWL